MRGCESTLVFCKNLAYIKLNTLRKIIAEGVFMNKKRNRYIHSDTVSAQNISNQGVECFDLINKYGTYNIQPTADTKNLFPTIAQGLPKREKDKK